MSAFGSLGFGPRNRPADNAADHTETVTPDRPLDRLLAFTGFSIDDVVDNPIAKNAVLGYYKLHRQVQRRCEIVDLERQWNPL